MLADIDPRIGVAYGVLSTDIRDTVIRERLLATLSGGFGVLALAGGRAASALLFGVRPYDPPALLLALSALAAIAFIASYAPAPRHEDRTGHRTPRRLNP